jgi:hypothetical protein
MHEHRSLYWHNFRDREDVLARLHVVYEILDSPKVRTSFKKHYAMEKTELFRVLENWKEKGNSNG